MAQGRLLISAPDPAGRRLLTAAQSAEIEVVWFHHPSSRDPTFELPVLATRFRPDVILLVEPKREEPTTLELLREQGAFVVAVVLPLERAAPRHMLSRQRWICRAADRVVVPHERSSELFRDRRGRPALANSLLESIGSSGSQRGNEADEGHTRSVVQCLATIWMDAGRTAS